MINYKNFYNSWQQYTKQAPRILQEGDRDYAFIIDKMDPAHFLALTTDAETYRSLMSNPSFQEPYKRKLAGTLALVVQIVQLRGKKLAQVISHEGRNRSVAALKIGAPVEVGIKIVPAGSEIPLADIQGFKSQLSSVVVKTADIISRGNELVHPAPAYDIGDPLGVDGEGGTLKLDGYSGQLNSLNANKKLQNYVTAQYINHPSAQVGALMKSAFVANLNKLYSVIDSGGQAYTFDYSDVKTHIDPVTKQQVRSGLKTLNLIPNPLEVYGSEEEANKKIYTVSRK